MRLFDHGPNREDELLAEALGLLDDGLDPEFVAALYPDDEAWLAPLLGTTASVTAAYDAEPSYFFEASLKSKVLAAANDRTAPAAPAGWMGMMRSATAGATVMVGAALFGVLTLGFVTADNAVPGDWNYTFKLAGEQFRYTLSRGDERIDLQIEFTENRVAEINRKLESGGAISPADVTKVEREARELAARFSSAEFPQDPERRERLATLGETSATVLTAVREREVALQPQVTAAISTVNEAVVAGHGGTSLLPDATPTATVTSTATSEPTATETTEPGTVEPTETVTQEPPTATPTPEPPTPTPEPTETPEPSPTPDPESGTDPLETPAEDNEFTQ